MIIIYVIDGQGEPGASHQFLVSDQRFFFCKPNRNSIHFAKPNAKSDLFAKFEIFEKKHKNTIFGLPLTKFKVYCPIF